MSTILLHKQLVHMKNMKEIDRFTTLVQDEVIENVHKQLQDDDINFTGGLDKSVEKGGFEGYKTVEIKSPYAKPVEFGLPPGKRPNFDALRNWVENKLKVNDEKELIEVTIKIMNKIAGEGIKPKRFFKKAIKALIAKRGKLNIRNTRKISRFEKFTRKINRSSRSMAKKTNKISKLISKVDKVKRRVRR